MHSSWWMTIQREPQVPRRVPSLPTHVSRGGRRSLAKKAFVQTALDCVGSDEGHGEAQVWICGRTRPQR